MIKLNFMLDYFKIKRELANIKLANERELANIKLANETAEMINYALNNKIHFSYYYFFNYKGENEISIRASYKGQQTEKITNMANLVKFKKIVDKFEEIE